ncbi:hypothetical protein E2C01_037639 [Portunus trituberculatus]|uniref:Uncharacterized protein n=1 Tax=Portunus trituberculatus TaxID=210409 RepID=A0A5B7F9W2_PORTR|nr:hypothetical protein [Portunus trituberculatus]
MGYSAGDVLKGAGSALMPNDLTMGEDVREPGHQNGVNLEVDGFGDDGEQAGDRGDGDGPVVNEGLRRADFRDGRDVCRLPVCKTLTLKARGVDNGAQSCG